MMRATILAPLLALGGCISASLLPEPPPPPQLYVLEAQAVAELPQSPVDAVIAVALPTGERAILGPDLILRAGDTLRYIGGVQWSNRAADALQAMLAETLIRQGRFRASTRSGEASADYEIRWEVLDFEVREDTGRARFAADVRLVESGREIVAARLIEAEVDVGSAELSRSGVANALARAAREGSARIGEFAADAAAEASASADGD